MLFNSPYKLRIDTDDLIPRYLIAFRDCEGIRREMEVSHSFFREFWRLKNNERKMARWNERHIDQFEQTEETLREKMLKPPKSLEDEVFDSERDERLRLAIQQLPELQRRRFILHHEYGLTYEQIGQVENRHLTSIRESVLAAEEKIKKVLRDFEN